MDAKEELAVAPHTPTPTPTPPSPSPSPPNLFQHQMDKEEKTQLEAPKESEHAEITEENYNTLKTKDQEEQDKEITETATVKNIYAAVEEISGAEAAEESVKEEIKEASIALNNATEQTAETTELVKEEAEDQSNVAPVSETGETTIAAETTELVKEEAGDQSDVAPDSATLVSETGVALALVTPNPEEQKQTEDLATPVTETHEEDKQGVEELVKEEIKETDLPNQATDPDVAVDQTKDAEPIHATPATETHVNLQPEGKLPEVETEELKFQETSVAATGQEEEEEAENKETETDHELVKQVIKESKLPDSSLAVTPVDDAKSTAAPETKTTDTGAVTEEVHTEKEKANSDELKVENPDASPVVAESADVESEVIQVLPEKKKKRPLGDHLAEEKANDSVTANKQVSDEKLEVEPSEVLEQTATAVAPKESTEISSRDANTTNDTKSEADEKKEEDEKAAREVTTTKSAQEGEGEGEGEGEKIAEKESAPAGEAAAKEKVASKLTFRSSNNLLSKVKHQIVKVKKAIVRKSPSSKNMPVESKDDIKVK